MDWSIWSYFPLTTPIAFPKYLILGNPKYKVKNSALKTKSIITNGAPEKTSKKTILETKSERERSSWLVEITNRKC